MDSYEDVVDHKYVFSNMGYNLKPLDMQGAVGSVQLLKYEEIHDKRRSNKNKLHRILERVPGVRVMSEQKNAETSWFGVPVLCGSKELKHSLVKHFEDNKIQTRNFFFPMSSKDDVAQFRSTPMPRDSSRKAIASRVHSRANSSDASMPVTCFARNLSFLDRDRA